jgi:hypothetical protein
MNKYYGITNHYNDDISLNKNKLILNNINKSFDIRREECH